MAGKLHLHRVMGNGQELLDNPENLPITPAMAAREHDQVRARLITVFSEVLLGEVPSPDADLFDAGILDSQRFVELILHLEQSFQIRIDIQDFELENFRCIDKIAALIVHYNNGHRGDALSCASA